MTLRFWVWGFVDYIPSLVFVLISCFENVFNGWLGQQSRYNTRDKYSQMYLPRRSRHTWWRAGKYLLKTPA